MDTWRQTWREGIVPFLSTKSLEALKVALKKNDPEELLQGATTSPPPISCFMNCRVEGGCPVGICGRGEGLETVGEVEQFFANICMLCDKKLGEPTACRRLLNYWDDGPRETVVAEILDEVSLELEIRLAQNTAIAG